MLRGQTSSFTTTQKALPIAPQNCCDESSDHWTEHTIMKTADWLAGVGGTIAGTAGMIWGCYQKKQYVAI